MERQDSNLLKRVDELSAAEWAALGQRARELGVGEWRWEDAWLAARPGQPSAVMAYSRAISAGAAPIAAAAVAGAVAAWQTRASLTEDQFDTLIGAVVETIAPGAATMEGARSLAAA